MPVSAQYREYLFDCLSRVGDVRTRSMMGGYLVYYRQKLVALIGDGQLLVKRSPTVETLLADAELAYPYKESRTLMRVIENPEDTDLLRSVFSALYEELPDAPPKKKPKTSKTPDAK